MHFIELIHLVTSFMAYEISFVLHLALLMNKYGPLDTYAAFHV